MGEVMMDDLDLDTSRRSKLITWGSDLSTELFTKGYWSKARRAEIAQSIGAEPKPELQEYSTPNQLKEREDRAGMEAKENLLLGTTSSFSQPALQEYSTAD